MGFYGKITNKASSQFVFDKFYKTRLEMEAAANTDGVFVGRRVLVNYDEKDTGIERPNIKTDGYAWKLVTPEVAEDGTVCGKFKKSAGSEDYATTADAIDDLTKEPLTIIRVLAEDSTGEYTQDSYWFVNRELDRFELLFLADQSENYYVNYQLDNKKYGTSRGYDSTVWEKTNVEGQLKYVMIAELNSVVPTFDVSADAPTQKPLKPHFDSDSTNVYYKLHSQASWGMRVAEAEKDENDNVISDEKIEWHTPEYELDNISGLAKITDTIDVVDGDIYYNKAGFNPDIRSYNKNIEDSIKVLPNGKSGNKYNVHDGTNLKAELPDIQQISIHLPSLGNAMSNIWDLVYGQERNQNIDWQNKKGLRLINESDYDADGTSGFEYSLNKEQFTTLAGSINTLHDAIGDIVIEQPEAEEIDVKNKIVEDGVISHNDNTVNDSDFSHIYYYNNQYYRKHINYDLIPQVDEEGKAINPYAEGNEDLLYRPVNPKDEYYWYLKNFNYIKETLNEPTKHYVNINPKEETIKYKYEPDKYYTNREGTYILLREDSNSLNEDTYTLNSTLVTPLLPQVYEEIQGEQVISEVPRFWFIEGNNAKWDSEKAHGITLLNWREHPKNNCTYFQYTGTRKEEQIYDKDSGQFVKRTYWVLDDENTPSSITNICNYDMSYEPLKDEENIIVGYQGIKTHIDFEKTGRELQNDINKVDLNNTLYYSLTAPKHVLYEPDKFYIKQNDSYYLARNEFEDYEENSQFYSLTVKEITDTSLMLYEPNKFYYKDNQGKYDLDTSVKMELDRQYYLKNTFVVYEDTTNTYNIGHEWTVQSKELPNTIILASAVPYYDWEILPKFSRTLNTAFGLILKLNDMLQINDHLTRNESTLQGCINKIQDIITRFTTLHVGDLIIIDDYGRLHGTTQTSNQKFGYTNIGTGTVQDLDEGIEDRFIYWNVDTNVLDPKITLEHRFNPIEDTNTIADKNTDGAVGNGLNKDHGDTINLYTPIVDNMGHVVGKNTETVTLPYGFKTITTNGRVDSTITGHGNTSTLAKQSNVIADNTQDTLAINSGDAWTKITTNASGDSITISHDALVKTTSTSTQSLSTETSGTTTFDVVTYGFDATNHHSTTDTKTITMPNSYGKFTGDTGSSEATATHDTFAIVGDNWLTSTVEKDKITLTHDDANAVADRNPENKTPKFGDAFTIEDWRFDNKGHMYGGAESHTVTIPKGSLTQTTAKTDANILTTISFVDTTGAITVDRTNSGELKLGTYLAATSGANDDKITTDTTIAGALNTIQDRINTIVGGEQAGAVTEKFVDKGKTIRQIAREELADKLLTGEAQADFDTLQKLARWLEDHPEEVTAINKAIKDESDRAVGVEGTLSSLTTDSKTNLVSAINEIDSHADTAQAGVNTLNGLVGTVAVSEQINTAITNENLSQYLKSEDAATLYQPVGEYVPASEYNELKAKFDQLNNVTISNTQYLRNDYYSIINAPTYTKWGHMLQLIATVKCVQPSNSSWQLLFNDLPKAKNLNEAIIAVVPRNGGVPIRVKMNMNGGLEIAGGQAGEDWTEYYDIVYTYITEE